MLLVLVSMCAWDSAASIFELQKFYIGGTPGLNESNDTRVWEVVCADLVSLAVKVSMKVLNWSYSWL